MPYRVRAIVLVGIVCAFTVCGTLGRSQAVKAQETGIEKVQPLISGDATVAITTEEPEIPVEELRLLVKPLTLEELHHETAAWLLLLKDKVKKISHAEIAIQRQNQTIKKQQEAAYALEQAKQALTAAQEYQSRPYLGSPEFQKATTKVEQAQDNLKKAQSAVKKATANKTEIQNDVALSSAFNNAREIGELYQAKKVLNQAKRFRRQITTNSLAYESATGQIDTLEEAINTFENAQAAFKDTVPESPAFAQATQKLAAAQKSLIKAKELIAGTDNTQIDLTNQFSHVWETSKITSYGGTTIAGSIKVVNDTQSLNQKGKNLEIALKQLETNTAAESNLKNQLVMTVIDLQAERTAIVDRLRIVLNELERKGGDPQPYQQYIRAVSIFDVDLKDTQDLGVRLVSWFQSGEGGWRWSANLSQFVGIVISSVIISQILSLILQRLLYYCGSLSALLRQFMIMAVRRGGIIVGIMLALTALEISIGPILALLGGASFMLAFALQSNLSNFASGLMLMLYKPFDVGDEVKVNNIWGNVDSITLANTKIIGFNSQVFTIPNNVVWGGTIETLSHGKIRQIKIWLRIGFEEDLARVERLLLEIIQSHPKVLQDPHPRTNIWQVEDYYISVAANGWTVTNEFWGVHEDLIRMIRQQFEKEGIRLGAIPMQDIVVKQVLIESSFSESQKMISSEAVL
ncbi:MULTISPECIES: mechanosensitive ion channel domain-containing protein [Cyanophyceae]|uniref:mechanosensitive ion channel domain-containing protein n=1 Tax=Cyanophyceae TaxID=3028117 RepID=UPI00232AD662|nr:MULTISPECIES: mechanosensitive ion channel domain-containing protein [Cyanophyceae]MDB9355488.1 mechanosensitive ion channel [Nodularia spumigena CS-587/03]MDB9317653.1 mechanosensitive ion channel [Nodularia spumigena CS-590/01A]MDB9322190.1 mechanosensitive ion channel [Nodularia spumigena CS-591/07A]MDB9325864.1 mechanosensitive ion channel [Nodularia spumigena CS-590/02]MDB9333029.1 mechanosensitive ion channel [Nodularia spumigena CS-591/04]